MNDLQKFFADHPAAIGLLVALVGLFLFLGSVFDWNWIFGDVNRYNYNPGKIDGLVNLFGRKTARMIFGAFSVFVFFAGIVVIWLSFKK